MKRSTPNSEPNDTKGGGNKLWLILLVVVGGLFLLQKAGIKSVYRSESTSDVDFKSTEYRNRTAPEERIEPEEDVNNTLVNIDEAYGDEQIKAHVPSEKAGLGVDEKVFFNKLRQRYANNVDLQNQENWLIKLKSARNQYRAVRNAFEAVSEVELDETNLTPIVNNEAIRERIVIALEHQFKLPQNSLAKYKGVAVSDWALEIEGLTK